MRIESYKAERQGSAEIEITSEMIGAGLDAYWKFDREDLDPDERIVREIFVAMLLRSSLLMSSRQQSGP